MIREKRAQSDPGKPKATTSFHRLLQDYFAEWWEREYAEVPRPVHTGAVTGASALDVAISEIAWMGTTASSADEWIELYNNTGSDIDLTGWTLQAADGTPSIALAGTKGRS